jgi:hypothetical protein
MIDPDTMGQPGKRVKVPTLLIWGGEDRFLNISMAHRSAKYEIIIFLSFSFFKKIIVISFQRVGGGKL